MDDATFARQLARLSDRLCSRILHEDIAWVDVAIEIETLRDFVRDHAPDKLELFARVYESRFRRFWEQWHGDVHTGAV